MEFNLDRAPEEGAMIQYFWEGLKPLVRIEKEQGGWEVNNFDEIVEKAVYVKIEANFKSRSYICETD